MNADQVPVVAAQLGRDFFRGRHTIGVWAWELSTWPEEFLGAFEWVNEVWAISQFVQRTVAERAPVPVLHMPCAVSVEPAAGVWRSDFNLPDDRFLFLVMYDALSVQERKNPLGAIAAFRQAFPNPDRVGLVVRINHASSCPADVAPVRHAVDRTPGTWLVDRPMARAEAQALQACCDTFVSLHRSEGFGLNIAEAMLMSKPVITTAWSGNMDFTTGDNACLVDYRLVPLARNYGPYREGNEWAEPDLQQAAAFMARLVEDTRFGERLGRRGQASISEHFSPAVVGQRYRRRLAALDRHR